jgi:glycerol kinase
LLTTIALSLGGEVTYALEGSAFVTGAAVQWLRDGLGIITDAAETDALASSLSGNDGLYLVPAFVGLGAPHWDMYARGLLIGITRATSRAHLARATLESIAYQTRDLVQAMRAAGQELTALRVDGGGTANRFLMQFQADLLDVPVEVSAVRETTALGAAYLAGLAVRLWRDPEELRARRRVAERFEPRMGQVEREALYGDWSRAVERAKGWERVTLPGPA